MIRFLLLSVFIINALYSAAYAGGDTNTVNSLNSSAKKIAYTDPSRAIYLLDSSIKISRELNSTKGLAAAYNRKGIIYKNKGEFKTALPWFEKTAQLEMKNHNDKGVCAAIANMGNIYKDMGQYDDALLSYNKALGIAQAAKDSIFLYSLKSSIGSVYMEISDYPRSVELFLEALKGFEIIKDTSGIAMVLHNIGIVHAKSKEENKAIENFIRASVINRQNKNYQWLVNNLSAIAAMQIERNELPEAEKNLGEAVEISVRADDKYSLGLLYDQYGLLNEKKKQFNAALTYYKKSLNLRNRIGDLPGVGNSYYQLGCFYLLTEKYTAAINALDSAKMILDPLGAKKELSNTLLALSKAHEKNKSFAEAHQYMKSHNDLEKEIFTSEKQKTISDLHIRYDLEKKDMLVEKLKTESALKHETIKAKELELVNVNKSRFIYIAISVSLVVLLALFYLLYRQKAKINILLRRQNKIVLAKNSMLHSEKNETVLRMAELETYIKDRNKIVDQLMASKTNMILPEGLKNLSKREVEVVNYLAIGYTDQEIADKLFVSVSTIKTHLRRIYNKLLVRNRAELIALAHQYNILESKKT